MAFGTVILALWGLPANGQSAQTAPNAQAFIASIAKQYTVQILPGYGYSTDTIYVSFFLRDASSEDECRTKLSGDISYFSGKDLLGHFSGGASETAESLSRLTAALDRYRIIGLPYQLDWSRVVSVEQSNQYKDPKFGFGRLVDKSAVRILVNGKDFTLLFPSEQLAARATFAFEFLRQHCDKTAQTGF